MRRGEEEESPPRTAAPRRHNSGVSNVALRHSPLTRFPTEPSPPSTEQTAPPPLPQSPLAPVAPSPTNAADTPCEHGHQHRSSSSYPSSHYRLTCTTPPLLNTSLAVTVAFTDPETTPAVDTLSAPPATDVNVCASEDSTTRSPSTRCALRNSRRAVSDRERAARSASSGGTKSVKSGRRNQRERDGTEPGTDFSEFRGRQWTANAK